MKDLLGRALAQALTQARNAGRIPAVDAPPIILERPKQTAHGDLATNLAMQLAKPCKMNPRAVAQAIIDHMGDADGLLTKCEIAGPGFINFFVSPLAWLAVLPLIMAQGRDFGRGDLGHGKKAMVEFVSANPTGPLHVGHGRGAAVGDVLGRLLAFAGYEVTREYYINDAGNQMATLGRSVLIRARQGKGSDEPFPDNHYQGEYIVDLAKELLTQPSGAGILDKPGDEAVAVVAAWAGRKILDGIKADLEQFRVTITSWFSERSLVQRGAVEAAFTELRGRDLLYEHEGALWFKASALGDKKDRVVRRGTGELTYFASDIAYHLDKLKRVHGLLVDVWGADHHGYVPRLKAALQGLGGEPNDLTVVLVQTVSLLRNGVPVAMTTRGGQFVTLKEVVDEVGADSARFIFLTRRTEAPLDFDLEVAKAQSMDSPVFYVQYAHTRVKSVLRKAADNGTPLPDPAAVDLAALSLPEEVALAAKLAQWPELARTAARLLEPHHLTHYLHELAGAFHSYYNAHHILGQAPAVTAARLLLAQAVGGVLALGLDLLGVSAPEAM